MNSRSAYVAALATLLLLVGACGGDTEPSTTTTATSETPSDAASPAGEVIEYGEDGVAIEDAEDVSKLKGAPEDFKAFMTGLIEEVESDDSCEYPATYGVNVIDPVGYASGGFSQCGGHYIVWARVAGQWREVLGGQDYPRCRDLANLGVPVRIAEDLAESDKATCYDDEERTVQYKP